MFTNAIPGLTIVWSDTYNEWAEDFRITAYNDSTITAQKTIEGNKDIKTVVELEISDYRMITIEVLKWCLPNRYARIKSVFIGIQQVFKKSDLMEMTHGIDVDPLSAALPKSEIVFKIKNLNGEYNPDNPQGTTKYLLERQKISAKYGYKLDDGIEWIKAGTFYLSEWETPQNGITMSFTARDALEFMSDTYLGASSGTLYDIAEAAFIQANLPQISNNDIWVIDESLASIQAPNSIIDLSEKTIAEVLQYVANAACCVFYQDRDGFLHIEPLADDTTDYAINRFNSYANSDISLTKQLKAVDINNGQYVLTVGTSGETQTVNNPLISDAQAPVVAQWIANYLLHRRELSGNFRADPRLDALDRVTNSNQFSDSIVLVTSIQYTYNGAFRGYYEGRAGV